MAVDSAPERLRLRRAQAQVLAVLVHQVLVRPVDKKSKKFYTNRKFKKVMVLVKISRYLFCFLKINNIFLKVCRNSG